MGLAGDKIVIYIYKIAVSHTCRKKECVLRVRAGEVKFLPRCVESEFYFKYIKLTLILFVLLCICFAPLTREYPSFKVEIERCIDIFNTNHTVRFYKINLMIEPDPTELDPITYKLRNINNNNYSCYERSCCVRRARLGRIRRPSRRRWSAPARVRPRRRSPNASPWRRPCPPWWPPGRTATTSVGRYPCARLPSTTYRTRTITPPSVSRSDSQLHFPRISPRGAPHAF